MSDSDEDYMSDKFLAGLEAQQHPSLVQSRAKKREVEVQKRKEENCKRQRALASASNNINNTRLQKDLNQPIPEDNKGFQLLAKMGYKAGSGLGKQGNARTEPVGITIKSDRSGLGRERAIAELTAKREDLRRAHLLKKAGIQSDEEITAEAYRRRANQKAEERKLLYDVRRCQQTCESLDLEAGIQEPDMPCFWPPKPQEETASDEEKAEIEEPEELYSPLEQLELLTSYLRTSYNFCYWCGTHYESREDLRSNCPGTTRDDH